MIFRTLGVCLGLAVLGSGVAQAEPGLAGKVYGAVVDEGRKELELRYGQLNGGVADGEAQAIAEASYGVTGWWYSALLVEFEREPSEDFEAEAVAWENLFELTGDKDDLWRTAGYVELELSTKNGPGKAEVKGIVQYRPAPWDFRLNLILEREIGSGSSDDVEAGYAVRATRVVAHHLELGVEGFGDFGTFDHMGGSQPHYWGPIIAGEIELPRGELELQAGYLFGFGDTEGDGQFRFAVEWDFF